MHAIFASVVAVVVTVSTSAAQPYGAGMRGWGWSEDVMDPGMMMGPAMMRRGRFEGMCSPEAAGFVGWRVDRLEEIIRPTDAQRGKFDELKAASRKAAEAMRLACPTDRPATVVGRMEAMEKRMEAMLQSVKTIRPPLEAFYATLSDEQKARLDSPSPRWRFWRHLW